MIKIIILVILAFIYGIIFEQDRNGTLGKD